MAGEAFGITEEPIDIAPSFDEEDAPFVPDEKVVETPPEEAKEAAKTDSAAEEAPEAKEAEAPKEEEGAEEVAADEDSGGEEEAAVEAPEISRDIYRAAVEAGLSDDRIDALGNDAAIKVAIEIAKSYQPEKKGTETQEEEPAEEEWPELPAWDVEVPEELLSEESSIDPKTGKALKDIVEKFKQREDVFRAQIEALRTRQPKDSGANNVRDLIWNDKLDRLMRQDDSGAMSKLFGDGLDFEVSKQEFENREKFRVTTDELYREQAARGITPKLLDVMRQAYAITFPKEYEKAEKDKIRPKLQARQAQRISKPTAGKKQDTRSARQKAMDKLRERQEKMGISGTYTGDDEGFLSPF